MSLNQSNIVHISIVKETSNLPCRDDYFLTKRTNNQEIDIWWNDGDQLRGRTFKVEEFETFLKNKDWVILTDKD